MTEVTQESGAVLAVQQTPPADALLPITDLNHFVACLSTWHRQHVSNLENLLSVPDGTEASIDNEEPILLTGEALKGFKLGITMGLTQLGTLPFQVELEDVLGDPIEDNSNDPARP